MAASFAIDIRNKEGVISRLPVAGQNLIIGRARDVQIPLESGSVSRRHAEMLRDPFGRWWIRDLGSRNGTHVNGLRISEHVVRPGDVIQVGEFALTLAQIEEPAPEVSTATLAVPLVETDAGRISTLKEHETPRLAATHLSILSDFGQQLLSLEQAGQRYEALCGLMVRPEFRGRAAVMLRASKESFTEPAKPLCDPQRAAGYESWSPYISRTLLRTMLARNEPVLASNAGQTRGAAPAQADLAELSISADVMTISAVACPICSEKSHSDLLYVIFPPECGTSEWLALAGLAVKQFQQAESSHRARKLGEDHAAIERELARAHTIQERLVPRNMAIPHLDFAIGFQPCRWVGGDYVDVVRGPGGRVLLTVADVCGKGLPAALVASALHTHTHTAMRHNAALPDLMHNLNLYLAETLADGAFVTMLAAMLDPATGQLETINAGHPAGLVVSPDGQLVLTQQAANMPLGLDASATLVSETTTLASESYLVMFTDGLTELALADGQLLGEEALAGYVSRLVKSAGGSANDLAAKLTSVLDSLQEGMARDDRTFLLARRV